MTKELEALQAKFQTEVDKYNKAQKKYDKLVRQNGQLDTQLNENQMVKEELGVCKEDSRVFKLLGDVLVPQTLEEARSNVDRRMEYIQSECKRNTELINSQKGDLGTMRETVAKMEQQLQKTLKMAGAKPI